MSDAEQRVLDGTAWEQFCDALKEAGKIIQSEKAPKDAFNQAEGYRYLSRILRAALAPLFNRSADTMVDAFCARARILFGAG